RSRVRSRVEHPFHVVKRLWGFTQVRYRGLRKNAVRAYAAFFLANLYLVRKRLLGTSGAKYALWGGNPVVRPPLRPERTGLGRFRRSVAVNPEPSNHWLSTFSCSTRTTYRQASLCRLSLRRSPALFCCYAGGVALVAILVAVQWSTSSAE